MCKHVQKLLDAQRDIMSPQAVTTVTTSLRETEAVINNGAGDEELKTQIGKLEEAAGKWIKPYPHAEWRENIEVFLVAIVVAMGIRTFFLQPFKIPTGSMEPTLYGIEIWDERNNTNFSMPGPLGRIWDVVWDGTIYHEAIAADDGAVEEIGPLQHLFHFINKQTVFVRYRGHEGLTPITIYCGPDGRDYPPNSGHYVGLDQSYLKTTFNKGDQIFAFKETTGDHLFVDRMTYNFRRPERGEIVVFKTKGIEKIAQQDQFYIKRLIGLPGEKVSIGDDQHARINGKRLDASTPHFENVYGFNPSAPPREGRYGQYNGHVLEPRPDSYLQTPNDSIDILPDQFVVFGDNTLNSFDSRFWGALHEENVIGKAFFVYWPFSKRFGWGQQ